MVKKLFLIILFVFNIAILQSNDNYYRDVNNNHIELRTAINKYYIHFDNTANIQSILQNAVLIRSGINENPSWNNRLPDFVATEWAVIETNGGIQQNDQIFYSSPVYIFPDGSEVPVSHYFYVKLFNEADTNILKNVSLENNVDIVVQNDYMVLWY